MAAWEEAGCGRTLGALRTAVRRTEKSVLVEVAGEDRLCSLQEVVVASLHVREAGEGAGSLEVTGLG